MASDALPPEKTHARAKLVFNILKVLAVFFMEKKGKVAEALKEIKEANELLYDVVHTCWGRLTPEQIQFYIGPRPHYYDDGALAIYHPQLDNPLMQVILAVVDPEDADRFGQKKPKLVLPRSMGGIL